jgi:hypothetical protein
MIFAMASRAVPAIQATLFLLASKAIRPPATKPRCSWMVLRTYRASRSPLDSSISVRIASSSPPNSSMSAAVRCTYRLMSAIAMRRS